MVIIVEGETLWINFRNMLGEKKRVTENYIVDDNIFYKAKKTVTKIMRYLGIHTVLSF